MDVLKILYPDRCPGCDRALPIKSPLGFCEACTEKLIVLEEPLCPLCGRKVLKQEGLCKDCRTTERSFDAGRALYGYSSVTEGIYRFKYMNRFPYAKAYAREIVKYLGDWLEIIKPDVLIPVPLNKKRLIKRGYNQAEELAIEISLLTGIPVNSTSLVRIKNTTPQKTEGKKGRLSNMKKAFIVKENVVKFRRVVLIDDIFTTGSTIDACARELKDAGVERVYFLTLARAGE